MALVIVIGKITTPGRAKFTDKQATETKISNKY